MRTPHWLFALLVALVVGVVLGYSIAPDAVTPSPTPDLMPDNDQAPDEEAEMPLPESPLVPVEDPPDLLTALKALHREPLPIVEGVICGRVTAPDGSPIAGAEIRARPQFKTAHSEWKAITGPDDPQIWKYFEERTRSELHNTIASYLYMRVTRTGVDGTYRLDELVDAPYALDCYGVGYGFAAQSKGLVSAGETRDWVGEPLFRVILNVTCEFEVPADAEAIVECRQGRRNTSTRAGLNQSFTLELPAGTHRVFAELREYDARTETLEVTTGPGLEPRVELALRRPARLEVLIEYVGGTPAHDFDVVYALAKSGLSDPECVDERRGAVHRIWRGRHGFRSGPVEPGEYVVALQFMGQLRQTARVTVGSAGASLTLSVSAPAEADGIVCTVRMPSGSEGLLRFHVHPAIGYAHGEVWHLPDGRWLLKCDDTEGMRGPFEIEVKADGLGVVSSSVDAIRGASTTVEFLAPARALLSINNIPAGNAGLVLTISRVPQIPVRVSVGARMEQPHETGAFQPGGYWIIVNGNSGPYLYHAKHTFGPGETRRITIDLPELYELVIKRGESKAADYMSLQWTAMATGMSRPTIRFDDNGVCIAPYLPAGEYTIHYLPPDNSDWQKRTVNLRRDTEVDLSD